MNTDTTPTQGLYVSKSEFLELTRELAEKTNEVARLKNELRGEIGWRQAKESEVEKLHNEDARLRELLDRAIEIAEKLEKEGLSASQLIDLHYEIGAVKELAALAPAPEEPVSEGTRIAAEARSACNDLTEEERKRYASLAEDVLKLHKPDPEPIESQAPLCHNCKSSSQVWQDKDYQGAWVCHRAGCGRPVSQSEWREFTGTEERIQIGDQECHKEGCQVWYLAGGISVGQMASQYPNYRFRTRRPLPVREEIPLQTPLDLDIEGIVEVANHPLEPRVDFYTRQLAAHSAHAIRYLRDEIVSLNRRVGGVR